MEVELKILSIIGENNQNMTQRELSAKTNLSLGAINVLLKKMIETGLIKIEKLSTRTVRYMLTPNGMMEKAKKTYGYIKRTYEDILMIKGELEQIVQTLLEGDMLYLYGQENEVYHMLIMLLTDIMDETSFRKIETLEETSGKGVVVVWDEQEQDKLAGITFVNILDRMA